MHCLGGGLHCLIAPVTKCNSNRPPHSAMFTYTCYEIAREVNTEFMKLLTSSGSRCSADVLINTLNVTYEILHTLSVSFRRDVPVTYLTPLRTMVTQHPYKL